MILFDSLYHTEYKLQSIGKMMNEWMTKVQDSVFPLPSHVVQNQTRRTTELCLPTLISRGKCRSHSKHTVERVLQSDEWALSSKFTTLIFTIGTVPVHGDSETKAT